MSLPEPAPLFFAPLMLEYIPRIMLIESKAYPEPWTYNMFRQELENGNSYFCAMFQNGVMVGYGGFWLLLDEAHITRVTVIPELRCQGFALKLMQHLLEVALVRGAVVARLEVRESNYAAQALYDKMGFIREGRRKAYYHSSNEDAIVMVRKIQVEA